MNWRRQGDIGEASAIEWLTMKGYAVAVPIGHSPNWDVVADREFEVESGRPLPIPTAVDRAS